MWDRLLATLSVSRGQASVGSLSPSAEVHPSTWCRGHERELWGKLSLGGNGQRAGDVGSPWFARCRKLRGAGVCPAFAAMEEVILTVAFSPGTFLIRMDLAVRKARGHQK